jgi:hypothetical protein
VLVLYPDTGNVTVDSKNLARRTLSLSLSDSSTRNTVVRVPVYNTYSDVADEYVDYATIESFVSAYPVLKFISRFDVDLPPAEFVPETGFSPLSPFGNEIHVWRGVTYDDGSVEEVPLGVFINTNVEVSDNDQGVVINVNGVDRSLKISRNRWTAPYVAPAGNLVDVLSEILIDRFTDVELDLPQVGSVPKAAMTRQGWYRSVTPVYSFISNQTRPKDFPKPFSEESIFSELVKKDGEILLVGVGFVAIIAIIIALAIYFTSPPK